MNESIRDVIILGAGAAGLFCAFHAARRGLRVTVLERANKVGKKILMSGGGRCNFTHLAAGPEHFLSQNPHFCKSALARYAPAEFLALVEAHHIPWFEKTPGQLFCQDSSKSIVRLLLDECGDSQVEIRTRCEVDAVETDSEGFVLRTSIGPCRARKLVVATGGLSVPSLGGSDFGYRLARQFGHAVIPTRAGLVPLTFSPQHQPAWAEVAGISLPVAAACGDTVFRDAMLFTHRGLSGPAILQISSFWQRNEPLRVNLLPDRDAVEMLRSARHAEPQKPVVQWLAAQLPRRLAQRLAQEWGLEGPISDLSQQTLSELGVRLNAWEPGVTGTEGYRTAEVTLGGVDTAELSSRNFESRRQPGLHFIGEVLDVTGWLGGYNFQWAWASAHACAQAL